MFDAFLNFFGGGSGTTGFDLDGDGIPDLFLVDTDGDGTPDAFLSDSDGDGIPDSLLEDLDGDGIPDMLEDFLQDTDGDGIPDALPLDLDGDGIPDLFMVDTNGDGIPDAFLSDSDGDGIPDTLSDGYAASQQAGHTESEILEEGGTLTDSMVEELLGRVSGVERTEKFNPDGSDRGISFTGKACPTRHGCSGATSCDRSYGAYPY